jgi:hypothetical protein
VLLRTGRSDQTPGGAICGRVPKPSPEDQSGKEIVTESQAAPQDQKNLDWY